MKNINKGPRAGVIYARYSSHAQNDASIEQQIAECEAYAAQNNITLVNTYADRAISGRTDSRPAFQRMMRAAAQGQFEVVIAYKSNRIARNMLHALAYEEKLSKMGVDVIYCKEEFGNNAAGRFALRTMMNVNQFYSENMAEDITRGMIDRAKQGKHNGKPPYGYRIGPEGKLEIHEERAPIVREIYARIADGETYTAIAADLNARQIPSPTGAQWTKASFQLIMKNERYRGIYIYGDVRVPGGIPRIIDDVTFERVQDLIRRRGAVSGRRRGNGDYLLTGKLYCGLCGAPMIGVSGTSHRRNTYHYYFCANRQKHHTCDKRPIRRELIEEYITRMLVNDIIGDSRVREWLIDSVMHEQDERRKHSQLQRLKGELAEVETGLKNVLAAIEAGIFSDAVKQRLGDLETRRAELSAAIREQERQNLNVTRQDVAAWLDRFRQGRIDDRAFRERLVYTFLQRAYLFENRLVMAFSFAEESKNIVVLENLKSHLEHLGTGTDGILDCSDYELYDVSVSVPSNAGANQSRLFVVCTKKYPIQRW